ncbi:MAG: NVEALA domain-containing protein [Bacteroidales bacterium]|nr:NVEALA domain-containing protein [Bacteroidales bacterium]MDD4713415.1 NVEALA domain-containing protein [Bacteroidales bacterium]
MKKNIFGGIAIVAIAVLMAFNVNLNLKKSRHASLLGFANVEALANEEDGIHEKNTGWEILTQGATKDEEEWERPCPTSSTTSGSGSGSYSGVGVGGSGSTSQTNPSNRYEICCKYGYDNCTPVDC